MENITTISGLRSTLEIWRKDSMSVAFVPTMGNLHAGHMRLVSEAKQKADKVVVSIFVNPTQFGVGEDYESYPRTEVEDKQKLIKAGVDVLFLPAIREIYPNKASTLVSVGELSKIHCGAHRQGHFEGVATVVTKLFNIVQPDMAFFGEKDCQQLTVIRNLVKDLNFPIDIIAVATERESDGLAMSSRNGYLTEQQRAIAPLLYQALQCARDMVLSSCSSFRAIEKQQQLFLQAQGFKVDYFSICNRENLRLAMPDDKELVILVAAKLGKPRLIDNISFTVTH